MYSISPENEKNSLMSCSEALKETLVTFTVRTCQHKCKVSLTSIKLSTEKIPLLGGVFGIAIY